MSETFGTIVVVRSSDLNSINRDNIYQKKSEFSDILLTKAGVDLSCKQTEGYQIEDFVITDEYIGFTIFGHEWETYAQTAIKSDQYNEFYGALFTEYGESQFYTKNNGAIYSYRHDEESDEECQEGFDPEAYEALYENHKKQCLAITPQVIKDNFKPVVAYNPCTESFESQELTPQYELSEYSQRMQNQLPEMIDLLSNKDYSPYDFLSKYTLKDERGLKRLLNKFSPDLQSILLICLKSMQGTEPMVLDDDDYDEGALTYPVPLEECDKILEGMSETITFDWNNNRNKFMLPF